MLRNMKSKLLGVAGLVALSLIPGSNAYWLTGTTNVLTTERLDPIMNPGGIASHVHTIVGGSNFGPDINTAKLQASQCTSMPIKEDKSNYWVPTLYFQWKNGSFTSVHGGPVIYYLFDDKPGTTTAFPRDFRMISGTPNLRTYDPNSFAQKAIDFLCLDFKGKTTHFDALPSQRCPDGIRAQVNFQSCWDGKNVDSPDHMSHVAFRSGGPDSGNCNDPKFPVVLPRIFMEVYWYTPDFESARNQAMNPDQPFVFANGDPTGYGYHGDFFNGWDDGVLQRAVDGCTCNGGGDPQCCADKGIFTLRKDDKCFITPSFNEQTTGTMDKLPGNNPVQNGGRNAVSYPESNPPAQISPVYAYTGNAPTATGKVIGGPVTRSSDTSSSTQAPVSTEPPSTSSTPTPTSTTPTSSTTPVSSSTRTSSSSSQQPVTTSSPPPPPPPTTSSSTAPVTSSTSASVTVTTSSTSTASPTSSSTSSTSSSSSSPPPSPPHPTNVNPPRPPAGGHPPPPPPPPAQHGNNPPRPPVLPPGIRPPGIKPVILPVHNPGNTCSQGRRNNKARLAREEQHNHTHHRRSKFDDNAF